MQDTCDIMLVYNKFKKIRRAIRPIDNNWANFVSTSVQLGIKGTLAKISHQYF